jgi:energy-coupling factor transporter ATP-binding protein EcfA2
MVADPSLLFLDEPTSGLDSTTSFDLVSALLLLANKGVNIITVLHQPSYPLYKMFTNVLLLGKGGSTVFLGKSELALPYFTKLGYTMPELVNPADFFMDVIAGKCLRTVGSGQPPESSNILFDLWIHNGQLVDSGIFFGENAIVQSSVFELQNFQLNQHVQPIDPLAYKNLKPAGFWRALVVHVKRSMTQHTRNVDLLCFDIGLHILTGVMLGGVNGLVNVSNAASMFVYYSLGLCMVIGISSLRVFGNERVVFWREVSSWSSAKLYTSK